ncbi:MAG TPA: hypothetical protein VFP84_19930 [Kofleriaceae bacterium]|nr:hypothetical protein [Kofleriaceae bacterium]
MTAALSNAHAEIDRAALWRALGATPAQTDELLAYAESAFDLARAPARFPLADEPFVAAWTEYVDEAARVGAWPCLRARLVQLRFPIEAGISASPAYQAATRRGVWPAADERGLELARPEELRLFLTQTPVGRVPVILATAREDFVALVRALGHRNEPWPVPDAVGASIIGGLNNWDRVAALRRAWEASDATGSPLAWAARWREIVREPGLYQDRFIVLGSGPYSGTAAADVGLDDAAWTACSIALRLEHECTHHFTQRALGSMRNRLGDELIADYMGIVAATGGFRADWLVRFLGLERHPVFRPGGRLEEYRGDLALDGGSFRVLCDAVERCARNLAAIDQLRPPWDGSPAAVADKAEMILALAAIGLEGLASDAAVDMYRSARQRRAH